MAKKLFWLDLKLEVIDSVSLDAGIFLNQIRVVRDLAFLDPTWMTAPFGYPLQFTFLMTDNFVLQGLVFAFFNWLCNSETLAINLTKIFFNSLAGYLAYSYLKSRTVGAIFLSIIYQNCVFLFTSAHQAQLQTHFVFPLLLIVLERKLSPIQGFFLGLVWLTAYFSSAYYFVFIALITGVYFLANLKNVFSLKYFLSFSVPLFLLLPFLIPQMLISFQRERNIVELILYNFRPEFYFPFTSAPHFVYRGFLGYGFTLVTVAALVKLLNPFGTVSFLALLALSTLGEVFKSLVSFSLPFLAFFGKFNKTLTFAALLLISLSYGILHEYPTLLSLLIDYLETLKSVRVPVRYFVTGMFVIFLLGSRFRSFSIPFFGCVIMVFDLWGFRTDASKIPYSVSHPDEVQKFVVIGWHNLFRGSNPDWLGFTRFNQRHILKTYSPGRLMYNLNSGYGAENIKSFLKAVNSFPSNEAIATIKSFGIKYVYSTRKRRRSGLLEFVGRRGEYFIYRIKKAWIQGTAKMLIPPYAKNFKLFVSTANKCKVSLSFLNRNSVVNLNPGKVELELEIPGQVRWRVKPIELKLEATQCERLAIHEIRIH
ncbi:MAG: hypothetical protein NZO16_01750 [Deltaproteobacteria bacterium]|nr:hypothetical protein [Deltaproteobacteria bacterium]